MALTYTVQYCSSAWNSALCTYEYITTILNLSFLHFEEIVFPTTGIDSI